jgi:hypothetical protein
MNDFPSRSTHTVRIVEYASALPPLGEVGYINGLVVQDTREDFQWDYPKIRSHGFCSVALNWD